MNTGHRLTVASGIAATLSVLPLLPVTMTDGWFIPAVIAVALVTVTGVVTRRVGAPAPVDAMAQLAVLISWLGVLVASDAALIGFVPTPHWATRLVDVFGSGIDTITTYSPPIPVDDGIEMLLVGGAGVVAILVDLMVSTMRRAALAGVPLGICYAIAAGVVPDGLDWWWFLPPAAGFLTLMVSESRDRVTAWGRSASPSAGHPGIPETDSLARNGRRVGTVAVAAAVAVPGLVPVLTSGLLDSGLGGNGNGGQTIQTDNPIIDLQRNLQRDDNVEVLRYTSSVDEAQYIRTATLDVFDGEVWKTSERPVPNSVDDGLPPPPGLDLSDIPVADYTFDVTDNYSSRWLPLPYPTREIDIEGDWRYHAETLDVVARHDDVRSRTYSTRSLIVEPTVEMLRSAGVPSGDVQSALDLPDELPSILTYAATEVTAEATDDFGQAAALQEWLRHSGGFVYDLDVQAGHSSTALADFLRDRRGYCEQFAATMAIMARYLGIPARVATGFTPGDFQGDSSWRVRSHDAHAWPELYFEGVGWVRFEPTPASRTGLAPDWSMVPATEDSPAPSATPTAPAPTPTATAPQQPHDDDDPGAGAAAPTDDSSANWPLTVLTVVAAAALFCFPALVARLARDLRWRRAGDDPAAAAETAWADLRESVRDAGLDWDPAATPRSMGQAIATTSRLAGDDLAALSRIITTVERARFSPHAHPVPSLRADSQAIRRAILRSRPLGRRVLVFGWPSTHRDAVQTLTRRVAEGFVWLDDTGERLRAAVARPPRTTNSRTDSRAADTQD